MSQIYYKQSVNIKTSGWSKPMKTSDNAWRDPKSCRWHRLKKSAASVITKTPFAINTIMSWHKRRGHSVVRQDKVNGKYKTIYLMVTIPAKNKVNSNV